MKFQLQKTMHESTTSYFLRLPSIFVYADTIVSVNGYDENSEPANLLSIELYISTSRSYVSVFSKKEVKIKGVPHKIPDAVDQFHGHF